MKINNREKIMLYILLTVLIVYLGFAYVIEPQELENTDIEAQITSTTHEVNKLKALLTTEERLDQSIADMYTTLEETAEHYFNTTPQEEIILLFNDFLLMPFVDEDSISFGNSVENYDGLNLMKDTVTISVKGQYESFLNMLRTVWAFPKQIQVNNISLSGTASASAEEEEGALNDINLSAPAEEEVAGSVTFSLYTLMAETSVVDNLYKWYVDELFYKENPFTPYEENDMVVRYLYIGENDQLFNYGKFFEFKDIEGHWVEEEVIEFLEEGHLYTTPDQMFEPEALITRGEFIVMMDSVYDWEYNDNEEIDLTLFTDYDELGSMESSFAKAVYRGFMSGTIEGYSDNTLRPRDPMSYEEIEIVMNKNRGTEDFSWTLVAEDLTKNKGVTSEEWTNPKAHITKAEAVYLLYYFK